MDLKERNERIVAAIQGAVQDRKEKTWFDFYGVPFVEMNEYLNGDNIVVTRQQYDYFCECVKFSESFRNLLFSWMGSTSKVDCKIDEDVVTQPLSDVFQTIKQEYGKNG